MAEIGGELPLGGGQHVAPVLRDVALALGRTADGRTGGLGDGAHRGQQDVHSERLIGQLADPADLLAQLVRPHGGGADDAKAASVGDGGDQPVAGDAAHAGEDDGVLYA